MEFILDDEFWREEERHAIGNASCRKSGLRIVPRRAFAVIHALGEEVMAAAPAVYSAEQGLGAFIPREPRDFVHRTNEHGGTAEVDVLVHDEGRDAGHEIVD